MAKRRNRITGRKPRPNHIRARSSDLRARSSDPKARSRDLKAKSSDLRAKSSDLRAKSSDLKARSSDLRARSSEELRPTLRSIADLKIIGQGHDRHRTCFVTGRTAISNDITTNIELNGDTTLIITRDRMDGILINGY
ncbi:MAG TPA: hypothetical protein VLM18_03385 [Croceibacterium sp.]|nr:hypothetical protein [Croceibacterium sp.]